jgi:hypothetical protein
MPFMNPQNYTLAESLPTARAERVCFDRRCFSEYDIDSTRMS